MSYTSPAPAALQLKLTGTATPIAPSAGEDKAVIPGVPLLIESVTSTFLIPDVLFPLIVTIYVPGVAAAVLDTVKLVVLPGVTGLVPNVPVAPAGKPAALRVTGSEYPPKVPTSTVYTASSGWQTAIDAGVASSV